MKISRVQINNFRSFANFDLNLDGESMFVIGENGGGKTSLLTAIARALGRDLHFTAADFADRTQPIDIEVMLRDLSDPQASVFGNQADFATAPPTLRIATRAVWDDAAEDAEVEHYFPRVVGSRSNREQRDALTWQWVPSARDPERMLRFGMTRNLMGKLIEALPIDQSLDNAVDAVRQASTDLARDHDLSRFLTEARDEFANLLPDVAADAFSIGIAAATSRELLQQFELVIEHLGDPVPVTTQSSGVVQLAIFVFAMKLAASQPGTVLLVDEPEISLHPQAQRALMRALRGLNAQMIVATHSANLLDRADARRVARLRRTATGIDVASPGTLSDEDSRKLARFTSPQTAEAFFARAVVLVEGMSDQVALEALADRQGRNLDAEGISVVPMGGVTNTRAFLQLYGPTGFNLNVFGICDEGEEQIFFRALEHVGLGQNLTRQSMEALGFYVSVRDLEDELIRALGTARVERVIDQNGDLNAFQVFQRQPASSSLTHDEQLHAFLGKRKIEYAPLLVDELDLTAVPASLAGVLTHV
ncbi:MAG TPA: AAA family ATPase [Microbacteriaceae bacterium]|jgi:predicted ATP-dependent endonuclease of OLD family|nr:AAA family ATPase [Microbacteriaceae bacterium]